MTHGKGETFRFVPEPEVPLSTARMEQARELDTKMVHLDNKIYSASLTHVSNPNSQTQLHNELVRLSDEKARYGQEIRDICQDQKKESRRRYG